MTAFNRLIHRAEGNERVLQILFRKVSLFTADPTNYWTIVVRKVGKKPDGTRQAYGTQIGLIYSLATRSLTAGDPVTMFDNERVVLLTKDDELWATETSFSTPLPLTPSSYEIQTIPIVR